jgi:hypothetical protein
MDRMAARVSGVSESHDSMTLPREQLIGHEVHAPSLIDHTSPGPLAADRTALVASWSFSTHLKPFLAVQPIHQLVIYLPALTPQQDMQPLVAVVNTAGCQVPKTNPQLGPIITHALVVVSHPREPQCPAGSPFTHLVGHLDLLHLNA